MAKQPKKTAASPQIPTLDDVLISLQKSFSRVSRESAKVPEDEARAIIHGDINFALETAVDNVSGKIFINKDGVIKLSLSGQLGTDIRHE